MPERDYLSVPAGAVEADDLSQDGSGPFRQRITLADLDPVLRHLLAGLGALALSQEATSGRLRVLVDNITGNLLLGKINTIGGFGGAGTAGQPYLTDASYMPFEAMAQTWASTVRPLIT